jgi:FkbM family methyltransferase
MPALLDRARSLLDVARLVDERAAFAARQAARRRMVARYHLSGSPVAFHLRHVTDDVATLDQVIGQRHYELPPEAEQALDALGRPLEVVDLGANIGLFGAEVLGRWPDAHVVAFEPDPDNAAVLARTIAANPGLRWELEAACAGVEDGEITFAAGRFANSRISDDGTGVRVPVRDTYRWLERADLVKVDIEGAEWPLVDDPRFAALPARVLAFEFHPTGLADDVDPHALAVEKLTAAGYTVSEAHLESLPRHGMVWAWKRP